MKNKLRLITCLLLICALIPMNAMFAADPIDRDGDGINIDDIVFHLSSGTEPQSNSYISSLLCQVAPINQRSAEEVAASIRCVMAPTSGETSLVLPRVPTGYTIAIHSSSDTTVIGTNGAITPGAATDVVLVFVVTNSSDLTIAYTREITVSVSAGGPEGYTFCAKENGTCSFSGTAIVAFGAFGKFNYITSTTPIGCDNGVFGFDPIGGVSKSCYYKPVLLDRSGWTATATMNDTSPANALDGDGATRWNTSDQTPDDFYILDMKLARTFNVLVLDSTDSPSDYPRGYLVYVSSDGNDWGTAIASGTGESSVTTINFATQTKQYIKIVQTGTIGGVFWSIHELNVGLAL